jgi:Domain of unknown function (DUF4328)
MPPSFQLNLSLLQRRAWWVVFGCIVTALMSVGAAVSQGAALAEFGLPIPWAWQAWMMGEAFFMLVSAAFLATTIIWLFWIYRAVANLKAVSAPAMTWSPVAAVVWCLIPLVSVVMQFFIVRSIWQARFQRSDSAPLLVTLWALSVLLPAAATLIPMFQTGDLAAYDLRSEAAANGLQALSSLLQAVLVLQLTRAQTGLRNLADTFA